MASYTIKEVRLHRLMIPLKRPFTTHLQTVKERESIIVEMVDDDGHIGLGECVAFSSPWYTEETIQSCWDALVNWLIPSILHKKITKPEAIIEKLHHVKGNRMAKSALDLASWDLFAKRKERPLWQLFAGVRGEIDAGIVATGALDDGMIKQLENAMAQGYKRVKVKIDGATNVATLSEVIAQYPGLQFFADANGIFSQLGIEALKKLDHTGLTLIEQPFLEDEWVLHQEASKVMRTPIALDESIRSVDDVERMIDTGAGQIIVLKPGRVGGVTESIRIHELAVKHNIPMWIGGMIELGVSKAHNLALASLSQIDYPGDFSASNHFWEEDIVQPFIEVKQGQISLANESGIGYTLDSRSLKKYRQEFASFNGKNA